VELVLDFLDGNPETSVEVAWVPGHKGIPGNERADEEAKAACHIEPNTPRTTISHYYRALKADIAEQWRIAWANQPQTGRYAAADRTPPSLKGSFAFRNLPRIMLGVVTQVRTGHGYFGEYYRRFNIPEPHECPCGVELQSRTHILFECPLHDDARHLLFEATPDGQINSILGTEKGIKGLVAFLKASNAFRKLLNATHDIHPPDEPYADPRPAPPPSARR
jgi:hypothetical protein